MVSAANYPLPAPCHIPHQTSPTTSQPSSTGSRDPLAARKWRSRPSGHDAPGGKRKHSDWAATQLGLEHQKRDLGWMVGSYGGVGGQQVHQAHQLQTQGQGGDKRPIPMTSVKSQAAKFYRLKSGHAPTGVYLKWFGHWAGDKCWWYVGTVSQTQEHLFRHCRRCKDKQMTLWKSVEQATDWTAGRCRHVQISERFTIDPCILAGMDFFAATEFWKFRPKWLWLFWAAWGHGAWGRRWRQRGKTILSFFCFLSFDDLSCDSRDEGLWGWSSAIWPDCPEAEGISGSCHYLIIVNTWWLNINISHQTVPATRQLPHASQCLVSATELSPSAKCNSVGKLFATLLVTPVAITCALSTSRCFQPPLELCKLLLNSARASSHAPESTCTDGEVFRTLRYVTTTIVKFSRYWDLCAGLRKTTRAAETSAVVCIGIQCS